MNLFVPRTSCFVPRRNRNLRAFRMLESVQGRGMPSPYIPFTAVRCLPSAVNNLKFRIKN